MAVVLGDRRCYRSVKFGCLVVLAAADAVAAPEPSDSVVTTSLTATSQHQDDDQRTVMMVASATYTWPGGDSVWARLGWVHDKLAESSSVSNPFFAASTPIGMPEGFGLDVRVVAILPLGQGGGDDADPDRLRSSLMATDWGGPMFAPNHLTAALAAKLMFGRGRFFALLDSALYYAYRIRGEAIDPIGPDVLFSATKLVAGVAAPANFIVMAGAAQTRYWNDAEFLGGNDAARHDHYAFIAAEWSGTVGSTKLRPGLLYGRAIDDPKAPADFQIFELSMAADF